MMDDSSDLSSLPSSAPSSPLSILSNSPSPPPDDVPGFRSPTSLPYPSPPASQQTSQSGSPSPDVMDGAHCAKNGEGPPPAKRRRISKESSKERTTERLNLRADKLDPEQRPLLDRLMNVLHKKQKIVVIAGAGISVSAGIPDFRSASGLFRSLKDDYKLKGSGKDLFDASVYKDDTSTSSFHDMVSTMSRLTKDAKPTPFHHMLATIAKENRLLRLYSQNVDGIDTSLDPLKTTVPLRKNEAGKWPRTVQLHGGLDKMVCSKCHELSALDADLFAGPIPPLCPQCEVVNNIRTQHEGKRSHGIGRLRPRMVLYNEHNPDDEAIGAVTKEDLRKRPDAVIVVGTTLKVPGVRRIVREMCGVVRDRRGGVAIWINNDPPPVSKDLEDCWDIIVEGPSDEVAKRAAMRRWDEEVISYDFSEITEEDAKKAATKSLCPSLPSSSLLHLKSEPLPSSHHRNNSFAPPPEGFATPRKNLDRGPTPSPFTNKKASTASSVDNSFEDSENFSFISDDSSTAASYPTPTKSPRNAPIPIISLNDKLKAAQSKPATTKAGKGTGFTKVTKKSIVKFVKKPLSQTKAKPKAKTTALNAGTLNKAFKQSKGAVAMVGKDGKNPALVNHPTKLRQVSNATPAEPMHVVPPQDHRHNSSPLPSLCEDSAVFATKMTMRISNVIN